MDPRATRLAEVLLDRSLRLQAGDKLVICASDLTATDLLHEAYRIGVSRGAFVELDIAGIQMHRGRSDAGGFLRAFLENANDAQLTYVSPMAMEKLKWGTKFLFLISVHDDLFLSGVDPEKVAKWRAANFVMLESIINKEWVLTQFPTESLCRNLGLGMPEATDFYYNACLIDYDAEAKRLQGLQDVLDAGKRVRIQGPGTDLTLGIEGRLAAGTNLGNRNVPDGECFVGPEEDVTTGHIAFELPQVRDGNEVEGIRLVFEKGQIVQASADKNGEYFQKVLDSHPGNRRLGELGIGMNRFITKYIKTILFDEKIAGTVHMALGRSYDEERGGGKNKGSIHWDLIKDLRFPGTLVTVDDRPIIRDGEVLV
jgi:aminopeptidase